MTRIIADIRSKDSSKEKDLEELLHILENHWHLKEPDTGNEKQKVHMEAWFEGGGIVGLRSIHPEAIMSSSVVYSIGRDKTRADIHKERFGDYMQITINEDLMYKIYFKPVGD